MKHGYITRYAFRDFKENKQWTQFKEYPDMEYIVLIMISTSYIISKRFIIMKYTSTYEILCNKHNWHNATNWTTLSPVFPFFNKTKCWSCSLFNSSALAKSAKVNGEYHDPSTISSLASIITTKNNIATSLSTNNIRILLSSY